MYRRIWYYFCTNFKQKLRWSELPSILITCFPDVPSEKKKFASVLDVFPQIYKYD